MHPQSDRNLLFGILAVQLHFLSRSDFVTAMSSWVHDKVSPLADLLQQQGKLSSEQIAALDAVLVQHLRAHGDDPRRSLRAIPGASTVMSWLTPISEDGVQLTMTNLGEAATEDYCPPPQEERYRKLQAHDDGGQGVIWIAEDTQLHREVALKEIKPEHADNKTTRQRFLLEAQVTAKLEHPGVVPIHDLGRDAEGRPHYVMRFLAGGRLSEQIHAFHDAEARRGRSPGEDRLLFRKLLRRFVDVCNAVAYAHSRGVLHRDLKPKNVMLGKFGETLVIDWGLTKTGVGLKPAESPTDEPPVLPTARDELDETLPGTLKGTIPYMSPEQALRRDDLAPTSDVYSLGAILYELLTGSRAYSSDVRGADQRRADILAKVQRGQFPAPATAKPDIPPALDAICCKAMAFAMKDRYQNALDLAADIEHWLADEPVSAYAESLPARAGRWARRHQKMVAGVTASLAVGLVMALAAAAAISAEQRETERERILAVKNYETSRKQAFNTIRLIQSSEAEIASSPAMWDRRKELYATTHDACAELLQQRPDDLDLQKQIAQILRFRANFHRLSNELDEAERCYKEAIALRETLHVKNPEEIEHELLLADTEREFAHLFMAVGNLEEAAVRFNRSLELAEKGRGDGTSAAYRRRLALGTFNLAIIEHRQGKHEQSDETLKKIERSEELLRGLLTVRAAERNPYDEVLLAATLNRKGMIQRDLRKLDAAINSHAEAVKLAQFAPRKSRRVNAADLMHFEAHCRIEQSKTFAKSAQGNLLSEAEKHVSAAITNLGILAREFRGYPGFQESLASAINERGQILRILAQSPLAAVRDPNMNQNQKPAEGTRVGLLKAARKDFEAARQSYVALIAKSSKLPELHWELAVAHTGLAKVAQELGDQDPSQNLKQAEIARQKALQLSPSDARFRNPPLAAE